MSHVAAVMPTCLPTTSPRMTPTMTGSRGHVSSAGVMVTPALASANRGTMRKLTQGWSECSRRSIGAWACSVTVSSSHRSSWSASPSPRGALTPVRSQRSAMSRARATKAGASRRTRAGMVAASSTPAMVAWTPERSTNTQSTIPSTAYTMGCRTPRRLATSSRTTTPAAAPTMATFRSSV